MLNVKNKIASLRNVSLFVHISEQDLVNIAQLAAEVQIPAGDPFIKPNGLTDCFYVLVAGKAKMIISTLSDIALYRNRGIVGEITLLSPQPCRSECIATADTTALRIEYKDFWQAMKQNSGLTLGVITELNRRLNELIDQLYRFSNAHDQQKRPLLFTTQFKKPTLPTANPTATPPDTKSAAIDKISFLRQIPLFAHLPDEALADVAPIAHETHFETGERFITQNSLDESVYIIIDGQAEIKIEGVGHIGFRSTGSVVGEMALISRKPRTAHCIAHTPIRALKIEHSDFWQLIKSQPHTALGIVTELNTRLEEAMENIHRLSSQLRDDAITSP